MNGWGAVDMFEYQGEGVYTADIELTQIVLNSKSLLKTGRQ